MLQSNAESNRTEVELLRDKNTKFIAQLARHQETITKLQEVGFCSLSSFLIGCKFIVLLPTFFTLFRKKLVIKIPVKEPPSVSISEIFCRSVSASKTQQTAHFKQNLQSTYLWSIFGLLLLIRCWD